MNIDEIDIVTTSIYLRLETIAFMIGIIVSFSNVVFVVVGKAKNVYIFLIVKTILSLLSDFILLPHTGIYGIAVSNIIVNTILSFTCWLVLYRQKHIEFSRFCKADFTMIKEWIKIGIFSGGQQFIDNLIYAVMVCKMVNMVAEQGNYWIANNFIWGWLLIPIGALSEVIKHDCKDDYNELKQSNYYFIAGCTVIIWILTIPFWIPFFKYAQNLKNANEIFNIVIKLMPFYIAYSGCAIIDNIFIGLGKTYYNSINSLIINFIYYGIFYVLYRIKAITFNMDTIIFMFGFGMIIHLVISLIQEKVFLKRNISLHFNSNKT